MKKTAFLTLMLLSVIVSAQLEQTKTEIIAEYGIDYTSGSMEDGATYIQYGSGINWTRMYFLPGEENCFMLQIMKPIAGLSGMLELFKEKNYEVVGDLEYRSPSGLICAIDVLTDSYIITMYVDF